jgi:YHS domain-containing protein
MKNFLLAITAFLSLSTATIGQAQSVRDVSKYNLDRDLQPGFSIALKGYDPVSYFQEGGGSPLQGKSEFRLDYMGATYLFASAAHLDLFVQNPDKYEPTYGGWCAYAMASGSQVDIQPDIFTIHGNRAHFFVSRRAKGNFDRDIQGHEQRADGFWKQISGEDPRF